MAIRTEAVSLDIRPCCDARGPVVCGRQGDDGTVLAVTVTRGGEPLALDGLTATLKGNVPGYTETAGTVDGSAATFALDSSVFAHRGVHRLYVELSQGADVVASTQSVELRVAPGADAGAGEAEEFESFIDQMKADYEAGIDQAEAAFDAALEAKQQEAQGLIDELDEALDALGLPVYRVAGESAVPSKECFYSFPDADMGCDVFGYSDGSEVHQIAPAWQTSRGPLVQAHGCAVGVPVAGARVYGETRQNLWVNPSGTVLGITATANDDGGVTLSGTSTAYVSVGAESFILRKGSTYTVVTDKMPPAGVSFRVRMYNGDTWVNDVVSGVTTTAETFMLPDNDTYDRVRFAVIAPAGTTVSGTYRIMLNEGSTAQPWCPPGLSSVGELGIVSAGRNLAGDVFATGDNSKPYADVMGIKTPLIPGATYTLSFDAADGWVGYVNENITKEYKAIRQAYGRRVATFTLVDEVPANQYNDYGYLNFVKNDYDNSVAPDFANTQLELGSTATAYEPPSITTTPIDLSGHELRGLPDGTRDVLSVDGSGAVGVEQATAEIVLDGSSDENWTLSPIDGNQFRFALGNATPGVVNDTLDPSEYLCDRLPKYSGSWTGNNVLINGIHQVFVTRNGLTTIEGLKSWLAQNPMTLVYPVATPQTVPIDPITPPTVPAADASLWAATDVPCDIEATTWTASGAEQGRQQAAMVKVAQQVRAQAEAVAALAAQSLEA